jgi:hypothetical protein
VEESHLIWRPNCFSPQEWDRLSRDEQIHWWRDQTTPSGLPLDPIKVVELYRRGVITLNEFTISVFKYMTESNILDFLRDCPEDLLIALRKESDRLPADDDAPGWGRLITISSASYVPWVTPEEIERCREEQRARYRDGLRLFRKAATGWGS